MLLSIKTRSTKSHNKHCRPMSLLEEEETVQFPEPGTQVFLRVPIDNMESTVRLMINMRVVFFQIYEMTTPLFPFELFDPEYFLSRGEQFSYLKSSLLQKELFMFYCWIFVACSLKSTHIAGERSKPPGQVIISDSKRKSIILSDILIFHRPIVEDNTVFVLIFLPSYITGEKTWIFWKCQNLKDEQKNKFLSTHTINL